MPSASPKNTQLHKEYLALVKEICGQRTDAYCWFEQVMETALVWDHVIDGDQVDSERVDFVFTVLTTEWILNDFFHANRTSLVPVLVNCISAWKHSNTLPLGSPKAYDLYTELPGALCLILKGKAGVNEFMPRIRNLMDRERREDAMRDRVPFLIVGLPRTRSAWLAAFLTDGDVFCHHEFLRTCAQPDEYTNKLLATDAIVIGDADPSIALFYEYLRTQLPKHRIVFINRASDDCLASNNRMIEEAGMDAAQHASVWPEVVAKFNAMKGQCRDAIEFDYADLDKMETVRALAEYCTGMPFNEARWHLFDELKVTAIPSKVMQNQKLIR